MTTGYYTDSFANALEQFTDYYPYGMPHASATSPSVNRRKYGGKELTTDCGLNLCDFSARWHNPAFPAFTSPDPLIEKYFSISPFTYCGGDPVNFIDPTGMEWDIIDLDDGKQEIRLSIRVIYDSPEAQELLKPLLQILSDNFNSMLMKTSNGNVGGFISYLNSDAPIEQSLTLTSMKSSKIAGNTFYIQSLVNIKSENNILKSFEQISNDVIHELLHTLKIEHPFEASQTTDTELESIGPRQYKSTNNTDSDIIHNAMNYSNLLIDGKITEPTNTITPGQLNIMIKEIKTQNILFAPYTTQLKSIPLGVLKKYYKY